MAPSILRPLVTLILKARSARSRRKHLAARLASAQRINAPPATCSEDQDYCHPTATQRLSQLIAQAHGDGLWKCCNAHEVELVHYAGRHPFKYLRCERCAHVLCDMCCTTAVVTQMNWSRDRFVQVPKTKKKDMDVVGYGQVCPGCGLSHRARVVKTVIDTAAHETVPTLSFDGQLCACGRLSDDEWVKFKIGSIEEYRRDPHNAFSELSLQRAEGSVLVQQDGVDRSASSSSSVSLRSGKRDSTPLLQSRHGSTSSIEPDEATPSMLVYDKSVLAPGSPLYNPTAKGFAINDNMVAIVPNPASTNPFDDSKDSKA